MPGSNPRRQLSITQALTHSPTQQKRRENKKSKSGKNPWAVIKTVSEFGGFNEKKKKEGDKEIKARKMNNAKNP